jgi:hypothetical protein
MFCHFKKEMIDDLAHPTSIEQLKMKSNYLLRGLSSGRLLDIGEDYSGRSASISTPAPS